MIAPVLIPDEYAAWNQQWHAPYGRRVPFQGAWAWSRPVLRYRGPFAFQPNNATRAYEYPWAYAQIVSRLQQGTIVEVGGGLSGFQYVLSKRGFRVINVDPGLQARGKGWDVTPESHAYFGKIFGAPVQLMPVTIDQAPLPDESVDAVLSISTLEHFVPQDLSLAARTIARVLKPNGWVILTIDLFLEIGRAHV